MAETSARAKMIVPNNVTWEDAFKFGVDGDTSWSFTGQNFRMDVKGNKDDVTPLMSVTSGAGQIVVDDAVQRVLHFNIPEGTFAPLLPPGEYRYDLIMYDNSTPAVRVALMHGEVRITQGITGG